MQKMQTSIHTSRNNSASKKRSKHSLQVNKVEKLYVYKVVNKNKKLEAS